MREVGTQRTHTVVCPNLTTEETLSLADRLCEILDMPEDWQESPASESGAAEESAGEVGVDEATPSEGGG